MRAPCSRSEGACRNSKMLRTQMEQARRVVATQIGPEPRLLQTQIMGQEAIRQARTRSGQGMPRLRPRLRPRMLAAPQMQVRDGLSHVRRRLEGIGMFLGPMQVTRRQPLRPAMVEREQWPNLDRTTPGVTIPERTILECRPNPDRTILEGTTREAIIPERTTLECRPNLD
jgi:hypothetical protein